MFSFKVAILAARDAADESSAEAGVTYHRFRGTFTFAQVAGAVAEMLPRTRSERNVVLEYADEEGDIVRIASEIEWAECLRLQAAAAASTRATSVVIRLTARWGERVRKGAEAPVAEAQPAASVNDRDADAAEVKPAVVVEEAVVIAPAAASVASPVVEPVASAGDFDSLSDDDFVAARASRDDERWFDREEQYNDKVANVPTMTPAVALLAPTAAAATVVAEPVARPWNNVNENARVLHAVFPGTPLKTIKAMLRKRRNNLNEVGDLLARGSVTD